jgi:hypothetical protein
MNRYNPSTFSRAHGVLRRNRRLDVMQGSRLKQHTGMSSPRPSEDQRRPKKLKTKPTTTIKPTM